jgi:hypothetical protein
VEWLYERRLKRFDLEGNAGSHHLSVCHLRQLIMAGWKPMKPMYVVNWCGHGGVHPVAGSGWLLGAGARLEMNLPLTRQLPSPPLAEQDRGIRAIAD